MCELEVQRQALEAAARTAGHTDWQGWQTDTQPGDAHGPGHTPGIWAAIFGVAALVAFIGIVAGYLWQLHGPTVIELINRHAATLGLVG